MPLDEICFTPAAELAARLRRREIGAVESTRAFLDRIARVNPRINAYVTVCAERALDEAARCDDAREPVGPLHGVPFAVKDLVWTEGVRTTSGSRIFADWVPPRDARAVARLRAAGAILLGKTNTPEFGYKATTENPLFGATLNPWNPALTPGGSSGGAAAAAAAGLAPLSLGTDGGRSIRVPPSYCGVFGLKPTFGLVPQRPGTGPWRSLAHTGPITRTVADAALMLDVIAGPDELDPLSVPRAIPSYSAALARPRAGLSIAWSADLGFAAVDPAVTKAVEGVLPAITTCGHSLEPAALDLAEAREVFEVLVAAENAAAYRGYVAGHRMEMDEGLVKFVERGLSGAAVDYLDAEQRRDALAERIAECFTRFDLLVTPTVAVPPFPIGAAPREIRGVKVGPLGWLAFTYPFNLTGHPAASLPFAATPDGLPIGLQIVGPHHADALVLDFAAQVEAVVGRAGLRPPEPAETAAPAPGEGEGR
jgi:Asp-tRNA(Asn)/Glu-tRNA(Gln) amidotransferase A subunit family amidase